MITDTDLARIRKHAVDYTGVPSNDVIAVLDALDAARAEAECIRRIEFTERESADNVRAENERLRLALAEVNTHRTRAIETVDTVREQNDLLRDALEAFVRASDEGDTVCDADVEQARALLATAPTLAERVAEPGFREGVSAARMVLDEATTAQDALKQQTEALTALWEKWAEGETGGERGMIDDVADLLSGGAVPEAAPVVWSAHPDGCGVETVRIGPWMATVWPDERGAYWALECDTEGHALTLAEAKAAAISAARSAK